MVNREYWEQYQNLGMNVAYYRKLRGYTQWQLAELLDIDRTHVSNIELASAGVSLDVLFHLANVLKIPISKFFEHIHNPDEKEVSIGKF